MVEFVFMMPWFLLLFVGAFDWGFFAHGLLSTENAARVATLYNVENGTAADFADARNYVLYELSAAVNVNMSLSGNSLPVIVTATKVTGPDGADAAQVTVEYQTQNLIPIPGLLGSQYTFYRVVKMKL
jgi:Flp pilus assembly protein TadG